MGDERKPHLTYRGNRDVGRHGWLRLTPAYSVRLVREIVSACPPGVVVTDPFSGTGTTALAAAEHGGRGYALDVNPFLVWLGATKLRHYGDPVLRAAEQRLREVLAAAGDLVRAPWLWQPPIFQIERWWSPATLSALKALRAAIDATPAGPVRDLLDVAFCRTVIAGSNAAFDHQSMSFKAAGGFEDGLATVVLRRYRREAEAIIASAAADLPGSGEIRAGDARSLAALSDVDGCDLLLTSPPYANRMSYIRELRPYMYWTRHLSDAAGAADLDWQAIGGTWGTATNRLSTWVADGPTPIGAELDRVGAAIVRDGGKSGPVLSAYVHKYFDDMWAHFQAAYEHVRSGGQVRYIVGNSSFSGHGVPAEQWYAELLGAAGFVDMSVTTIRRRNSNKALFEFDVAGRRP
jgi:hypothetical protein